MLNMIKRKLEEFENKKKLFEERRKIADQNEVLKLKAKNEDLKLRLEARRELVKEKELMQKQKKELFEKSPTGMIINQGKEFIKKFEKRTSEQRKRLIKAPSKPIKKFEKRTSEQRKRLIKSPSKPKDFNFKL